MQNFRCNGVLKNRLKKWNLHLKEPLQTWIFPSLIIVVFCTQGVVLNYDFFRKIFTPYSSHQQAHPLPSCRSKHSLAWNFLIHILLKDFIVANYSKHIMEHDKQLSGPNFFECPHQKKIESPHRNHNKSLSIYLLATQK